MTIERKENWSLGANNRADKADLPIKDEGMSFREGVNIDVAKGGALAGRIGFEKIFAAGNCRCLLSLGDNLVFLLNDWAISFNKSMAGEVIDFVDPWVTMAGIEHTAELFMMFSNGVARRYNGKTMRQWGVDTAEALPSATSNSSGPLMDGAYKYAVTFVNSYGEEGGALIGSINSTGSIEFSDFQEPPANHTIRLYLSECNGSTLYLQEEFIWVPDKVFYCNNIYSNDIVLETQFKRSPPPGKMLASYNGLILIADGKTLWKCDPFRPHQFDRATGFFQYPENITNIYGVDAGIYITADKTYFLTQAETNEPALRIIADFGAIEGSMIRATAQSVTWMTEYGPAFGDLEGQVSFPLRDAYSPSLFTKAASGVIRHNGNEIVVTVPQDDVVGGGIKSLGHSDSSIQTPIQSVPAAQSLGAAFTFIDEVIPA